jgi:hypothetical protein
MELNAGDVAALNDRGERLAVLGDGDGIRRDRRDVAVGEVDLRARADACHNRRLALDRQTVPADMRNLERGCAEPVAGAWQQAEARALGRLFAAAEQPLKPQADAEQRMPLNDAGTD